MIIPTQHHINLAHQALFHPSELGWEVIDMTQPTDKVRADFEAWLSTLPRRPHTPAAYDWCLATWQVSRTAALNEQSAEIERLKGEIAHLREVASIQHEYEEVCEFYIQCSPTPKGLLEWFGTISKDIP